MRRIHITTRQDWRRWKRTGAASRLLRLSPAPTVTQHGWLSIAKRPPSTTCGKISKTHAQAIVASGMPDPDEGVRYTEYIHIVLDIKVEFCINFGRGDMPGFAGCKPSPMWDPSLGIQLDDPQPDVAKPEKEEEELRDDRSADQAGSPSRWALRLTNYMPKSTARNLQQSLDSSSRPHAWLDPEPLKVTKAADIDRSQGSNTCVTRASGSSSHRLIRVD